MVQSTVLSHFQTQHLLQARNNGETGITIQLDLGLKSGDAVIERDRVIIFNSISIDWKKIKKINSSKNNCFIVTDGAIKKIQLFSEHSGQPYSLMPTSGPPTMLISGTLMHRIKGTDPQKDTLEKIKTIQPIRGNVLDTATGLGYTAIEAAKTAEQVTTIEIDPAAQEIAKSNPWSQKLFNNKKIKQLIGDSFDLVQQFNDKTFARIIHDPPVFTMAGHLYSNEFYKEILRILEPNGRFFHYIGNPDSKSGSKTTQGVVKRLKNVGFSRIQLKKRAFGVAASKRSF